MGTFSFRSLAIAFLTVTLVSSNVPARAQTLSANSSGVEAFFAAQSEVYKDSDPTGATWGLAGIGPYPSGAGIPSLSAAPAPGIAPAPGNGFSGTGWTSNFNDSAGTTATSVIADSYLTSPVLTSDVSIAIPFFTVNQNAAAVGFAYEQINFGSNYLITTNPGLGANPAPNFPIFVNGAVISPGTYAQFDGEVHYDWTPVSVNTAGILAATGPTVSLGTLSYAFLQPSGGTFTAVVPSTGALAATPAGDGILSLTGQMWIAGDPFTLIATTTPEPASLSLFAVGGMLIIGRRQTRSSD
jgi:hypothetical protein